MPTSWTPDQIKQFQDYWDTEFAGDLAKRRRAKFVPGEAAAKVVQTKEPSLKDDFDEWLARIICYAFSVPPQWATKVMNRATADNQSQQAADEGLEPTKEWVKDLVDAIIADEFASPDLELAWLDEDEADPKGLEAVLEGRVKLGAFTLNEMRDALGLDPYANAAADRAMVLTATGYVPIEANAEGQGGAVNAGPARQQRNGSADRSGAQSPAVPGTLIQKYSPDQPRVPAGNRDGGQWTSEGGGRGRGRGRGRGSSSSDVMAGTVAEQHEGSQHGPQYAALDSGSWTDASANGASELTDGSIDAAESSSATSGVVLATLVTPRGFTLDRVPSDPLDPKKLNKPILPDEQQQIADTLTLIFSQEVGTLNEHPYENRPRRVTGAVLPPSLMGYVAFDVPGGDAGRGERRILMDVATGAVYYTNNHYQSFYPINLNPRGE